MNNKNNNDKKMNHEVELNNNKGEIKMNKKELKKINKKNVCGTFSSNKEFAKDFQRITGKLPVFTKINKIKYTIDEEIDAEKITTKEQVLQRRYELIYEFYGEDIENHKEELEAQEELETQQELEAQEELEAPKTKYQIELPYTSSGVMLGYGGGTFGGAGFIGSRAGEGQTRWRYHKCYVRENGLSIEETGDFIRFDKIESINTGKEEGILVKHINVSLELKNDKTFSFRIAPRDLSLLKIIEDNMIPEDDIISEKNTTVEDNNSVLDELLKAKELLEAGLLSDEEFKELKIKLLNDM